VLVRCEVGLSRIKNTLSSRGRDHKSERPLAGWRVLKSKDGYARLSMASAEEKVPSRCAGDE